MLATAISLLFAAGAGAGLAVLASSTRRGLALYRLYRGELARVTVAERRALAAAQPAFEEIAQGMGWLAADAAQVRRATARRPFSVGAASRRRVAAAALPALPACRAAA